MHSQLIPFAIYNHPKQTPYIQEKMEPHFQILEIQFLILEIHCLILRIKFLMLNNHCLILKLRISNIKNWISYIRKEFLILENEFLIYRENIFDIQILSRNSTLAPNTNEEEFLPVTYCQPSRLNWASARTIFNIQYQLLLHSSFTCSA